MTRRRLLWIWIAVAAAVIVAAAVVVGVVSRPSEPDAVAQEYLDALAAGDGERALSRVQEQPDDGVDRTGMLAGASELITEPRVVGVDRPSDGTSAEVAISYALSGEAHEGSLILDRVDGEWAITGGALAAVEVASDLGDTALLGDVRVPLGVVEVLPARYDVRAAPADILIGEGGITALPGAVRPVALDAELSPDALAEAQEQLDEYARACAAPATEVADACGFVLPWAARLSRLDAVTYRIDALPALALAADGGSFEATGGDIVATVAGPGLDGAPTTATYRDDDWSLRGVVRIDGDTLTLAVR
jgi:hypothetical protein